MKHLISSECCGHFAIFFLFTVLWCLNDDLAEDAKRLSMKMYDVNSESMTLDMAKMSWSDIVISPWTTEL